MSTQEALEQYYLTQVKPRWPESSIFYKKQLLNVLDIEWKVLIWTTCVFIVKKDWSFCVKDRRTWKSLDINPQMRITSLWEEEFNVPVMMLHAQLSQSTPWCSLELETMEVDCWIRFFVSWEIVIFICWTQVCWVSLFQYVCSDNLL